MDMLGGAVGGAAGWLRCKVEADNRIGAPLGRMAGMSVDREQRNGDGCDGDVRRGRGGGTKQRSELVVVEKSVVALKVSIQIVFHCCAR